MMAMTSTKRTSRKKTKRVTSHTAHVASRNKLLSNLTDECLHSYFESLNGHKPGDLYRALGSLAEAGINLSRIESRPSGSGPWRYRFLVQVSGDAAVEPLAGALALLHEHTSSMRVLGSFDAGGE